MNYSAQARSTEDRCVFCQIVAGSEPASVIYENEQLMAFMTIRPTRPGECLVIPKQHVDHFTDINDELSMEIMLVAQKIGRRVREVFQPQRVGMVIHGFGVAHAHLIVVPQQDPDDITSARFAYVEDGKVAFDASRIPKEDRSTLDQHAERLRFGVAEA